LTIKRIVTVDCGTSAVKVACWDISRPLPRLLDYRISLIDMTKVDGNDQMHRLRTESHLNRLIMEMDLKKRPTVTCLGGAGVLLRYVRVPPVPPWKLKLLMRYEVQEGSIDSASGIAHDYRVLDLPNHAKELVILLGLAKESLAEEAEWMLENAGLKPRDLTLPTTSIFELLAFTHRQDTPGMDQPVCMGIDIGHESMNVVIYRGTDLYFCRTVHPGAERFTASVEDAFDANSDEAFKIIKDRGEIIPWEKMEGMDATSEEYKLSDALHRAGGELAAGIQSAQMYAKSQLRWSVLEIEKLVITGGGSQLKGLDAFLSKRFEIPVARLDIAPEVDFSSIDPERRDKAAEDMPTLALCAGMALNQNEGRRCTMRLLTDKTKNRQFFMAHTLYSWMAGAVAALALVLWVTAALYFQSARASELDFQDTTLAQAEVKQKSFNQILAEHKRWRDQYLATQGYIHSSHVLLESMTNLRQLIPSNLYLKRLLTERAATGGIQAILVKGEVYQRTTTKRAQESVREFADILEKEDLFLKADIVTNPTNDSNGFSIRIIIEEEPADDAA